LNFSDYKEDLAELKHRIKIIGITLLCSVMFFLVAPASLNENFLGFYKPFVSTLLDSIRSFLLPSNVSLIPGSLSSPIIIYTESSLFFGFLVASPVIFYEIYRFVEPAFETFPKKMIGVSLILFLTGCGFGFFVMMPAVIYGLFAFFPYVGVSQNLIVAQDFYSMVFTITLISGLSFLTPIGIYLASMFGFDPKTLTSKRWYTWAIVYVISAVITPDSNILADFVLFIPLILMIEASLFIASRSKKKLV
jgi:sec-independent protein translocase protein TatC